MRMAVYTIALALLCQPLWAQVGPNIDELARDLSNPRAANATLNFKLEYRTFEAGLPDAEDQDTVTASFQPVFLFLLNNGNNLIFCPAFSYVIVQPVAAASGLSDVSQFGDFCSDLLRSWNSNGWTVPFGVQVTKTTAPGNQLIKLNAGIEKIVIATDAFAEDWTFTFQVSPVTSNPFQRTPPPAPVDEATRAAVLAPIR
jgi:hypothetical protein